MTTQYLKVKSELNFKIDTIRTTLILCMHV